MKQLDAPAALVISGSIAAMFQHLALAYLGRLAAPRSPREFNAAGETAVQLLDEPTRLILEIQARCMVYALLSQQQIYDDAELNACAMECDLDPEGRWAT